MKPILTACLIVCGLCGEAAATRVLDENFEGAFPPANWTAVSIDQSATYKHAGNYSAKFSANTDSLITPPIASAETLTFWSYTTSTDPGIVVEQSSGTNGPWSAVSGSPFSGNAGQWNQRTVVVSNRYVRFGKSGSGTLYLDDVTIDGGAGASNQPPVLSPIGNRTVLEMEPLTFSVTASDPVDRDLVLLGATGLPAGAVFTNGMFLWSHAAPAGAYIITFSASDKDGGDSETVTLTVVERPKLLISEVADPSGTGGDVCRFVELYNAGASSINLSADGWTLSKQVNGGTWYNVPLTGTVSAAGTYLVAYSAPDFQSAYGRAPDMESATISGNGNDAYFLYYQGGPSGGTLIDIYGQTDTDGTATSWDYADGHAVRNSRVFQPSSVWNVSEWTIESGAGPDEMTPGAHGPTPQFQGLENPFVFLGDDLRTIVTAVNTVRTDVISLSATALPSGATFTAVTGTNTVSGTLNWNNPTAGVYTATFAAAGKAGTTVADITISVSGGSRIDGYFYGWKNGTVVKLKNGQFWKNTGGVGSVCPGLFNPNIVVTNRAGTRYMMIESVAESKAVTQIDVTESSVTNAFTGLHNLNVYQLADGTIWKQISFENIPSNASSVTAWRWMENRVQQMRFIDRADRVIGSCIVEASGAPENAPVVSEVDGYFRGWQNKRIFALKNGQFWQQTSIESSSQTLYRPAVIISNWLQTGSWRMSLAGEVGYVSVQPLTNVTRTAVAGNFYGFGCKNIFRLANGSWWKQTSLDCSTSMRTAPEILIWRENGTDYLEMPDEGRRIVAEELHPLLESTVTNSFAGLHHGNIYRCAGASDWIQLSFEHISTNFTAPTVMLWAEGAVTNMVVRDSRDVTIGTCIVADPSADADGDGLNNSAEVLAGADPLNAKSAFKLYQKDTRVLSWDSVEGRVYAIGWTASLAEPFQTLENSIAWPQNSWTDTVHAAGTKGFYRVSVRLAE
ncbi:MAG: lamin tail domain-containing protein [Verrucomicrobia bacterium]|nr:lamin tail domain-containing protein [Verrucomicrobiota bacterium]